MVVVWFAQVKRLFKSCSKCCVPSHRFIHNYAIVNEWQLPHWHFFCPHLSPTIFKTSWVLHEIIHQIHTLCCLIGHMEGLGFFGSNSLLSLGGTYCRIKHHQIAAAGMCFLQSVRMGVVDDISFLIVCKSTTFPSPWRLSFQSVWCRAWIIFPVESLKWELLHHKTVNNSFTFK